MIRSLVICGSVLTACPGLASDASVVFGLPSGQPPLSERTSALDSYDLPIGPFADGQIPVRQLEGRIMRWSWQLGADDLTTLQILDPLRKKAKDMGFQIVFECNQRICGGFDFRFGTEVIPAPDMAVDIGDYRFLSAVRDEGEALSLLVSRSGQIGYVQAIQVIPKGVEQGTGFPAEPKPDDPNQPNAAGELETNDVPDLLSTLERHGRGVLRDLEFATGSSSLGPGPYPSLEALAGLLRDNRRYRLALVGHTDTVGSLKDNISLSRQRAEAVRQRLLERYSIDADRIEADGVGYLAPLVSNATPAGREQNRRVEAVLLPR